MRKGSAKSVADEVADEVGVSRPTLYKWRHQLLGRDTTAPMPPVWKVAMPRRHLR